MNYTFQFDQVLAAWPQLLQGTWVTIQLSFLAMIIGLAVAIVCAWGKTSGPAPLRFVINAYIELIRNTPFLVQLFFFFFALPAVGLRWSPQTAALVAMVVNLGAYATEIIRAGIESIHRGQLEAAECLGLSRTQTYLHVIIRPALERVYPALSSQYVLLMLASSILSSVGVEELFGMANRIQSDTFRNFEVFVVLGILYLFLAVVVRAGFSLLGLALFPRRRKLGTPL